MVALIAHNFVYNTKP